MVCVCSAGEGWWCAACRCRADRSLGWVTTSSDGSVVWGRNDTTSASGFGGREGGGWAVCGGEGLGDGRTLAGDCSRASGSCGAAGRDFGGRARGSVGRGAVGKGDGSVAASARSALNYAAASVSLRLWRWESRNSLLGASCITGSSRCLPAGRIVDANWRVAREVVIAVAGLADAVVAANDDVRCQRVAGTESTIGSTGRADELVGGGVAGRVSIEGEVDGKRNSLDNLG